MMADLCCPSSITVVLYGRNYVGLFGLMRSGVSSQMSSFQVVMTTTNLLWMNE